MSPVRLMTIGLCATLAQQPSPRPGQTALVSGVVVDAGSGQVLGGARVLLMSSTPEPERSATVTDDQGRFEFRDVGVGAYHLSADKPPYARAFYREAAPGQPGPALVVDERGVSGARIALAPGAVIAGRVLDPYGAPAAWTEVRVERVGAANPMQRFLPSSPVQFDTDDQGQYRIFGLASGEYRVWAGYRRNESRQSSTDGPSTSLMPVYFPNTADPQQAQTIGLGAGEVRSGVDFQLQLAVIGSVSGTVTGDAPSQCYVQTLLVVVGTAETLFGTTSGGRFSFERVPPGRYLVTARCQPSQNGYVPEPPKAPAKWWWADAEIVVAGDPVTGVVLTITPMSTVLGSVIPSGAGTASISSRRLRLELVSLRLRQSPRDVPGAAVDAAGTFAVPNVVPGRNRVVVRDEVGDERPVEFVEVGGVRSSAGTLEVPAGADLRDVVVRIKG